MDELTLMRDFRAERARPNPAAKALAWRALEARFEAAGTMSLPVADPPRVGRRRRRLFGFAAATAFAAILAGVLVLSSGPTAQPASAAEVLRRTASIAAAESGPGLFPNPHQLIYRKTEQMQLEQWAPGEWTGSYGITTTRPTTVYAGKVRFTEEAWMSTKRRGRLRLVLGGIGFLSAAERHRWKAAGSPLPLSFSGETNAAPFEHVLKNHRGVRDVEVLDGPGYGKFAGLPTAPAALRGTLERKQAHAPKGRIDNGRVIAELWDILEKANASPALRAAVFNALAEEPGIEIDRTGKDFVGRSGYAISYASHKASLFQRGGVRVEYIFDPDTSAILGKRETLVDPRKHVDKGVPAGTVLYDIAYLGSGIVDSTHERPS